MLQTMQHAEPTAHNHKQFLEKVVVPLPFVCFYVGMKIGKFCRTCINIAYFEQTYNYNIHAAYSHVSVSAQVVYCKLRNCGGSALHDWLHPTGCHLLPDSQKNKKNEKSAWYDHLLSASGFAM